MSVALMEPAPPVPIAVLRARAGDRDALRALYEAHVGAVHGYCLAFCRGDREAAADLVQETFLRAFEALPELRDPAAFPGFLRTTTRRACLRWIERRKAEDAAVARFAREPTSSGPPLPDRAAAVVAEVIDACPDPDLVAAARLYYREPPHDTDAIALRLGISRTAVTTRLWRFRAWARRAMLARLATALEDPS